MEPKLRQKHEVIIIGAGASGMAAAVALAEGGADVALIEANDMPGKKLLATGNGKCNFTNSFQNLECYRGNHPEAAMLLLKRFDVPYILGFFERLGILPKQREGYWYPNSEQAASVQEAFWLRLLELGVPVYENTHADSVCRMREEDSGKADADVMEASAAAGKRNVRKGEKAGNFLIAASHRRRLDLGKNSCLKTPFTEIPEKKPSGKNGKKTVKKTGKPVLSQPCEVWFEARYLVLATGGCAGNISGADGSGYALAEGFGHRIIPPVPALVQLRAKKEALTALSGVRVQAGVLLRISKKRSEKNGRTRRETYKTGGEAALWAKQGFTGREGRKGGAYCVREYRERGEILFADYGLSGIPAMQLSRFAARELAKGEECGEIEIFLDFFPDTSENDLQQMLAGRFAAFKSRTAAQALNGLLPSKLTAALLLEAQAKDAALDFCRRLAHCMKQFRFEICGTNDFTSAQATAGGVALEELEVTAMESKREEGLYVIGELADIDGTCGGYNLHWAWMSGLAAAEGIKEALIKSAFP